MSSRRIMVVLAGVGIAGMTMAWQLVGDGSPGGSASSHADDSIVPREGASLLGVPDAPGVSPPAGVAAAGVANATEEIDITAEPLPASTDPNLANLSDPPLSPDGVRMLSFDLLGSFDYEVAMDATDDATSRRGQMPPVIRRLDGQRVEIEGFMLPLDFERGRVQSFYLNRDTSACCFGVIPPVNQVIRVHMPDKKGVPNYSNIPIIVTGEFQITESAGEFGFVTSLFRIDADTVEKALWQ